MYLKKLKKEQKENFLNLAYCMACIDGNYSEMEKEVLESYCFEMEINLPTEWRKNPEEILLELSQKTTQQEKKIIAFEIIGLAMCDLNYDVKEKELIEKIVNTFDLDEKYVENCSSIIYEYLEIQRKMNKLVIENN